MLVITPARYITPCTRHYPPRAGGLDGRARRSLGAGLEGGNELLQAFHDFRGAGVPELVEEDVVAGGSFLVGRDGPVVSDVDILRDRGSEGSDRFVLYPVLLS